MAFPEWHCRTCQFWAPPYDEEGDEAGECRRHAPRPNKERSQQDWHEQVPTFKEAGALWPITYAHEWCGEWRQWEPPKPHA